MNIDSILAQEGRDDIKVKTVDLGSVTGVDADVFFTTNELFDNFPDELKPKTVILDNFVDLASIKEKLDEKLVVPFNKLCRAGNVLFGEELLSIRERPDSGFKNDLYHLRRCRLSRYVLMNGDLGVKSLRRKLPTKVLEPLKVQLSSEFKDR
ncbi:hypothetical protein [Lancefieldella rimae]|uniref:hypothetical protein n=1 Tax=Lancefieldella rimae TaxID=1383 RepID=UPI002352BAB6|nr:MULTISPECIES: hypothetical protein [Coriobacteriales]